MKSVFFLALLINSVVAFTQETKNGRLKVFIDCNTTWCDMRYIKSALTVVDFLHDNVAADVYVLVTSQNTGGGGNQYQLIFYGQQTFKSRGDTLRFTTDPNATDFEQRDLMLKWLKTGLVPFIARTRDAGSMEINFRAPAATDATSSGSEQIKDPWKAWVIRLGADGNMNGDANYQSINYSGNFSANKITENLKTGFGMYLNKNKSTFEYGDSGTIQKFVVNNRNWSVNQYMIKSISSHWSASYEFRLSQNSFSNNKSRLYLRLAAEYNLFSYKEVNNRLFTLSYGITGRNNHYYDSTIYNKKHERLYGHQATAFLSFTQKWGNSHVGVTYHNYFSNWEFFNVGAQAYSSVRVSGGLSVFIFAYGNFIRDQVYLIKGNASAEEVLARRRQLETGYNFYTSIGLSFRFGSKLNNVVNPRFDRSGAVGEE